MSSRRRRVASTEKKKFPKNILAGIESLVDGNETIIASMFGLSQSDTRGALVERLMDCMNMNNLTAEMLLARFFDSSVLSQYCIGVLNKSGKGSAMTLSARIAREWAKPGFENTSVKDTSKQLQTIDHSSSKRQRSTSNEDKCTGDVPVDKIKRQKVTVDKLKVSVPNLSTTVKSLARLWKSINKNEHGDKCKEAIKDVLEILQSLYEVRVTRDIVVNTGLGKVIGKISKRSHVDEIKAAATALKHKFIEQLDEIND